MPSTASDLLPLDLRLQTIEAQLYGVPSSIIGDSASEGAQTRHQSQGHSQRSNTHKGVTHRVRDAEDIFQRLASQSEGLKRLLEGYEQYLPFLTPPNTNQPTTSETTASLTTNDDGATSGNNANANTDTRPSQRVSESDLLPESVKITMILEAAMDIKNAERDLREIDVLRQRGADGSGDLEELLPHRMTLVQALESTRQRSVEMEKARRKVGGLLMRYNEVTSTTSDLFIDVHHQLEALEDRVRALERKKRKEIASRF